MGSLPLFRRVRNQFFCRVNADLNSVDKSKQHFLSPLFTTVLSEFIPLTKIQKLLNRHGKVGADGKTSTVHPKNLGLITSSALFDNYVTFSVKAHTAFNLPRPV